MPTGYYLLKPHEQEIADTLMGGGFTPQEAIEEVVALVSWAKSTSCDR